MRIEVWILIGGVQCRLTEKLGHGLASSPSTESGRRKCHAPRQKESLRSHLSVFWRPPTIILPCSDGTS